MPRDLLAERDGTFNDMPQLEKPTAHSSEDNSTGTKDKIERDMDKQDAWIEIKPYTKSLTPSDVETCLRLENATFPPQERADKEKASQTYETLPCCTFRSRDGLCPLVPSPNLAQQPLFLNVWLHLSHPAFPARLCHIRDGLMSPFPKSNRCRLDLELSDQTQMPEFVS